MSARPVLLITGALVVGLTASLLVFRGDEDALDGDAASAPRGQAKIAEAKSERRKAVRVKPQRRMAAAPSRGKAERVKAVDDGDEANLTADQKRVMDELQQAMDDDNLRRVRAVLAKFKAQASKGGLEGAVPLCLRQKAVDALRWFGKSTAVDLMEYMADADGDVASDAQNAFEMALQDPGMSDFERSSLVTSALKAIGDADQVDTLLQQINEMRNSVKVQTITEILSTGTETARTKMQEQIGDYTDGDVTTAEQLETWLKENPDDATDAETYGGDKDGKSTDGR